MPVTVNEVNEQKKFVYAGHDNEINVDFYSHLDDPRFFLLFDNYGNIAGIRTGYIKSDIEKGAEKKKIAFPYDYSKISMFKSGISWGQDIWYANVLFVHPDKLQSGGRTRTNGIVAEGVFVTLDGKWVEVAKDECQVEKQNFTKQACFLAMGQHYFYKTTPSLDCKEMQPFFGLYNNGELHGFGLVPFGSFTSKKGGQSWFEDVPRLAAELIIPNGPQCAYEWTELFKLSSLHVFFRDSARFTLCPLWGSNKCKK
uniref:Uncharacterized protein n=3 Tax=Clastoptera arizonana TaxID=38151 RepID=A0A1B6DHP9_9HEMI